jgi:hypothetical protein
MRSAGVVGAGLGLEFLDRTDSSAHSGSSDEGSLSGEFPTERIPETPTYVVGQPADGEHHATMSFWNDAELPRELLLFLAGSPDGSIKWLEVEMNPDEVISLEFREPADYELRYRFEDEWKTRFLPAGRIDCNDSITGISLHADGSTSLYAFTTQLKCEQGSAIQR